MAHLKNKIVTVFGASGFVGRHVVAALIKEGAIIRAISRYENRGYALRTGALVGQVVPMQVDFNQKSSLKATLEGADYALNLIGVLNESGSNTFTEIHDTLAKCIAKACEKQGVQHLVHVSALGAHAEAQSKYQRSKAAGEAHVLKAFKTATILRPSLIFGEGDGFFTRFAKLSRLLPILPMIGGGQTKFQPVFIGDVVDTILTSFFEHDKDPAFFQGKIIECAGPEVYSFKDLVRYTQKQIGCTTGFVSLPWWVSISKGWILQNLPGHLLTMDQVRSLKSDNIETGQHLTLEDIGIITTPIEAIIPDYIKAFRTGGQFKDTKRI